MPAKAYDVAIVGAGLNGLVAAAYLARAGRSVVVVERRDTLGGSSSSEEFAPGFRSSVAFDSAELLHPSILRDLDLERHGLELLSGRGGTWVPDGDEGLHLPANGSGGSLQGKDAAALVAFEEFLQRLAGALTSVFTEPLPELKPRGPGDLFELLTLGWRLRGLGKTEMPEAMRYLPMPIKDVVDERFQSETLKAAIAGPGLLGSWLAPRSAGSALTRLLHRPSWTSGLFAPPVFPRGGMGALAETVATSARAQGAEIRTGDGVLRILHDDAGRTSGLALASGEEIAADCVISNVDPRRTLLELADPTELDPQDAVAAGNIRCRGTVAVVHLALGELVPIGGQSGEEHLGGRIQIGADLDDLERAFDGVKYGELPAKPFLRVSVPSLTDPDLAPAGKHVMHVWTQYVPYHLAEGHWDERRDELGDLVVKTLEEHAPGLTEKIEHRRILTPADLAERFGCSGGSLYHAEPALDQLLFLRPMAGWYQYRTPIDRLYLCGPGTHPGIPTTGLMGKNAAAQVLADWKAR